MVIELPINQIICGDCLEVMREFPDKSIDVCITDPPYGIGKEFANDDLDEDKLLDLWHDSLSMIYQVLKPNGSLLIEVPKNKNFYWQCFTGFTYEYCLILHTTNGIRKCKIGYNKFSICLWFSVNGAKVKKRYTDLISKPIKNEIENFRHPSPKNVEHYKTLIQMFSNPGDLILDPFCGSGTTCVAAKMLGRRWIGIDIEQKYCDIAEQRLAGVSEDLFIEVK